MKLLPTMSIRLACYCLRVECRMAQPRRQFPHGRGDVVARWRTSEAVDRRRRRRCLSDRHAPGDSGCRRTAISQTDLQSVVNGGRFQTSKETRRRRHAFEFVVRQLADERFRFADAPSTAACQDRRRQGSTAVGIDLGVGL